MRSHNTARDWMRLLYFLSQNVISFIGVVLTTSSAVTLIAFWVYDFMLPGPSHPYVGILLFLILPGLLVLGLLLVPIGILGRRRKLRAAGELPTTYPEIDLKLPMVRNSLMFSQEGRGTFEGGLSGPRDGEKENHRGHYQLLPNKLPGNLQH